MRKLKLAVDALKVESFETFAALAERRGTVRGASGPGPFQPVEESVVFCPSHDITGPCCEYTFALSCVQTNCEDCGPVYP